MRPEDPLADVLRGLAREKKVISMVHEMSRRVNISTYIGERLLADEKTRARLENRTVDLGNVARAIKTESERRNV